tara:strand:- start:6554 stop:8563 length:2010 start_codon:yes stop_codon:yes gene_type:complete
MSLIAQKLISASGPKEETDDDFNLVTSLYHFDGSNGAQNKTFLDSSTNGFTVTRYGSSTQGTFSPFSADDGKWSVEFSGGGTSTTSRLIYQLSSTTTFAFGTGDFTIEAWVFPRSTLTLPNANFILDFRSGNNVVMYLAYSSSTGSYNLYGWTGNAASGINLNAWNHVAIVRESGSEKGFVNGVEKYSASETSNHGNAGITIGNRYASTWNPFDGFISNVRVVKGTAVYTSNFTPSTSPLTNVTNTVTLGLRSNRFVESVASVTPSPSDSTIKIQPFSPFAPSAAYDAAVNGGSGYFDGSGDYLTVPTSDDFAFGTGDYTIEAWVYKTTTGQEHIYEGRNGGNTNRILFYVNSSNKLASYINASVKGAATSDFPLNSWVHVALVRSGTTGYMFQNGTQVATWTGDSTNIAKPNATLYIGSDNSGSNYFWEGSISSLRVLKGTALYTSAFTPPTAPSTAITNTKLLLNFTNAAIFDQTGKTTVMTRANAQLDTSVKKFGTASLELDGASDYLEVTNKDLAPVGTQSFTIECFVYVNANKNYNGIYSAGTGIQMYVNSSGKLQCWLANSGGTFFVNGFQGTTVIPTSTWRHIALVRDFSAGTLTWFVEGLEKGQQTSITDSVVGLTTYSHTIGSYESGSYEFNGFIDEFRITNKARYTSNFTAPTKEFPNL